MFPLNNQENTQRKPDDSDSVPLTVVRQLPMDWRHPSLNFDMGGYWGIYWGDRLMFCEKHLEDAKEILTICNMEYIVQ